MFSVPILLGYYSVVYKYVSLKVQIILRPEFVLFLIGAKKGAAPAKGKNTAKDAQKKPEKKWSKEDDAARMIQTQIRGYLARKKLQMKKKDKQNYEELMEKLEKEVSCDFLLV